MWNNGDDFNDEGERVRLYQPIAFSSGRSFSQSDLKVSFIGGGASPADNDDSNYCEVCHDPLVRLVQLYVPKRNVTFQVMGCNRAKCVNTLFSDGQTLFSKGGGGVFQCHSLDATKNTSAINGTQLEPKMEVEPTLSTPPVTKKQPEVNDWMVDSDDDDDRDDLEQQIAAMELKQSKNYNGTAAKQTTKSKKSASISNKSKSKTKPCDGVLPCFELHSLLEPPAKQRPTGHDSDDDDDNLGATSNVASDAKIQQMLAKYMEEEEDPEILAMLHGSSSGGGGNKFGEKESKVKAADRALLKFQDRLKRSPRQVLRYAPNGIPLWSRPRPQEINANNNQQSKKSRVAFRNTSKNGDNHDNADAMSIPTCPCCGGPRQFIFQLLPSILHILDVDKHAPSSSSSQPSNGNAPTKNILEVLLQADAGGMNWGVIAIYACLQDGCRESEGYVVVQASVDESPTKRAVAPLDAAIFIDEQQTFNALTDDGNAVVGCFDDEDSDYAEQEVGDESDMVFTLDG